MKDKYNNQDIDIFKEMGSIGSGNAATAISKMLGKKVVIKPITTKMVPLEDVPKELGGAEKIVLAVYLIITGDMSGNAVFLLEKEKAFKIIEYLIGNKKENKELSPVEISAYKEMSNIFTASYLNAISNMIDISIYPSIPYYATDMLGALIDFFLSEIGREIDSILLIKTDIIIEDNEVEGAYMLLFNPDSLSKIKTKIKEKFGLNDS